MMETLLTDLSSQYEDTNVNSNNRKNDQINIPLVVVDTPTITSTRKDSIVIPSISNNSISSVIQLENNNNNTLLPVCTSNSLGDLSSTPLLTLDNPTSNSPISSTTNQHDESTTATTFIQCESLPSSSSSSLSKSTVSSQSQQISVTHESLKNEPEDEIKPKISLTPKKAPAPPPPIESFPTKRAVSQSTGENIFYSEDDKYLSDQHQSRRLLNRQNHQRHGSADLLCRHINHEYMNRSSTTNSSFYPSENIIPNQINYYDYDQNISYVEQLEHELKLTKEQLNATMKSIKTFWSPELKKERTLRKDESCRYQLLINDHQKRVKQDTYIQSLEHQLKQMRDELEKSRHNLHYELTSIPSTFSIPEQPSIDTNTILQKQYQDIKDKLEQRINDLHSKENECVTLKAKVDTYESKEKDLQHYISILKESILIKDQQVNMIQSEINDLRTRLKEKDSIIEKKNSKIQSTRLDRQQCEYDLQESKQQLDIRDRKINVLNRKIENLEEQLRDKSTQIALARAKLTAVTTTASTMNVQQQTSITTNTLVSNLETTVAEKERLIEKLREQKHTLDIEHQEEIEQLQKTLNDTRLKLEQKEKDYYEGQNHIIELNEQINNAKSLLQRRETHIQTLEQQIINLKQVKIDSGDTTKLEYENRALQDRLTSYELERTEMKREIEWMQQELEQQKNLPLSTTNDQTEQEQQYELILNKKQQRIEELEQVVRESLQITTEREYAMTQQKRKVENLEKQIKTLQHEIEHLRNENNEQSQILSQLQFELNERKRQYEQRLEEQIKHLDNAFISQQEKILGELSEKDSRIADLEMDRTSNGASNRANMIERLNTEKQQLHNQLKELTEIRMKIIQDHMASKEEYEEKEKLVSFSPLTDGDGIFC
ncbi:unnamed protein product [Rotaria sordida]|uniref:Uncharacterized protein n=1 Tax=Rotaria sordida TaxID=392033 RepID=A0A813PYU3_9BILA|nr:unnamed protein product [Rotaria sordida]CAF0755824.1 unnamed protein product [Rotaria sordida]CAF0811190.1 unnamed protein product [Rotaria sordida]